MNKKKKGGKIEEYNNNAQQCSTKSCTGLSSNPQIEFLFGKNFI